MDQNVLAVSQTYPIPEQEEDQEVEVEQRHEGKNGHSNKVDRERTLVEKDLNVDTLVTHKKRVKT